MARFYNPIPAAFSVNDGKIVQYSPTWNGTGIQYTDNPASGYYTTIGKLAIVQIDVFFTNVTNFGSGEYSVTLPFKSQYHTDVYGGSVHDVSATIHHYSLKGHLVPSSNVCTLWYISGSSQDQPFTQNAPVNLTTNDKFHMSFSYIKE